MRNEAAMKTVIALLALMVVLTGCNGNLSGEAKGGVPGKPGGGDDGAKPECSDRLDNDGDGSVDLDDAGCQNKKDVDESNCGDAVCEGDETCSSCSADCGSCEPVCGDGTCNGAETCSTCEVDCGACPSECGDGNCDADEDCTTCEADCGACPVPDSCADSDGSDPFTLGWVYGYQDGDWYNESDYCTGLYSVKEWICHTTSPFSFDHDCSWNMTGNMSGYCQNGRCL